MSNATTLLSEHPIFKGLAAVVTTADSSPTISVLPSAIAEHDGSLFVWDAAAQALRVTRLASAISHSAQPPAGPDTATTSAPPTSAPAANGAAGTGSASAAAPPSFQVTLHIAGCALANNPTVCISLKHSCLTLGILHIVCVCVYIIYALQTLAALKPPQFHIHSISINAPGTHALLYGDHGMAVMELPAKSNGYFLRYPTGARATATAVSSDVVPDNRCVCRVVDDLLCPACNGSSCYQN